MLTFWILKKRQGVREGACKFSLLVDITCIFLFPPRLGHEFKHDSVSGVSGFRGPRSIYIQYLGGFATIYLCAEHEEASGCCARAQFRNSIRTKKLENPSLVIKMLLPPLIRSQVLKRARQGDDRDAVRAEDQRKHTVPLLLQIKASRPKFPQYELPIFGHIRAYLETSGLLSSKVSLSKSNTRSFRITTVWCLVCWMVLVH